MGDVKLTLDMSDEEFVAYVRDRCSLTIRNTAAGVYLDGLATRLIERSRQLQQLEAKTAELERIKKGGGI